MSTHVIDLAELTSEHGGGGKAVRLGELLRAGFAVPPGFVVVFDSPDEPLAAGAAIEIEKRVADLGDAVSVRSSAAAEDRNSFSAPGLFRSLVPSASTSVLESIAAVRASAITDAAKRYAELTDTAFPSPMAVIIGRYVPASSAGTLYLENADSHDEAVERKVIEVREGPPLSDDQRKDLRELGRRIGLRLGLEHIDLEWVIDTSGQTWIVQARPLATSTTVAQPVPPPVDAFAFASRTPLQTWHWDAAHNPLPLSTAHRGLVEWVVENAGANLAIAAGYLYEAEHQARTTDDDRLTNEDVARDLEAVFFAEVAPTLDALLADGEHRRLGLFEALDVFAEVYRTYAIKIAPRVSRAKKRRGETRAALQPSLGAGLLATIARGNAFGEFAVGYARSQRTTEASYWFAHAPRWDIAEPCLSEDHATYSAFCELLVNRRGQLREQGQERDLESPTATQNLADLAHAVGELDDRFFYRAQRLVRQAILDLPGDLDATDRFFLSLESLQQWATSDALPREAHQQIAANKKQWTEEASYTMPYTVSGTERDSPPHVRALAQTILRGRGRGGQASGRVHRTDHPTARAVAPPPGSVIVASDLSPGEIVLCAEAVAVVLETNRLLGHAVAMAAELGIPIVVGVSVAGLIDGEMVWLDGAAGTLVRSHS